MGEWRRQQVVGSSASNQCLRQVTASTSWASSLESYLPHCDIQVDILVDTLWHSRSTTISSAVTSASDCDILVDADRLEVGTA